MKVRLPALRVNWRRNQTYHRASFPRRNSLRDLVHEQVVLPAARNIQYKLLQIHGQCAAVMELGQKQERLPSRNHCGQNLSISSIELLCHGTTVWGPWTNS